MRSFLESIGERYRDALSGAMYYARPHYMVIYLLAACITTPFYFIDLLYEPTFDTFWFRLSGTLVSLIPAYAVYTKVSDAKLTAYSLFGATYLLMWMFPAMLMTNAASTPPGESMHYAWISMYLVSMFLYVQFVSNFLLSFTGWLLGFIGAALCILFVKDPNIDSVIENVFEPFSIFFTVIVFGNLLNRHIEAVERDKTEAARAIGGNIAHELRTPLTGITSRANALERLLPELAEGYQVAISNGLIDKPLTRKQLELLNESLSDIKAEANYSNTVISMLLVNTSEERFDQISNDEFTGSELLRGTLDRYPFPNNIEKDMVSIVGDDCEALIVAPKLLVEHVLFNLIKNALFHCQRANKGTITLSAQKEESGVCVLVRDTGPGIEPDVLPKIYDRFYTTSPLGRGSGIGLNFCKNIMRGIGGTIDCRSVLDEYTEFRVFFPTNDRSES